MKAIASKLLFVRFELDSSESRSSLLVVIDYFSSRAVSVGSTPTAPGGSLGPPSLIIACSSS
jgi:hypothetical protein